MSDGLVGQGDGQCRTDVSDRETDSVGQMCRTRTDNVRWTGRTGRRTASDGYVGKRDRQCQTYVSDKNRQCRTDVSNRQTDSGQRWAALDKRCRYGDTVETEETEETETRLIF